MVDINSHEFDECREWIRKAVKKNISWEELRYARKKDEQGLRKFIEIRIFEDFWPETLTPEVWYRIIDAAEDSAKKIEEITIAKIADPTLKQNDTKASDRPNSAWQSYKKHLRGQGWTEIAISQIEKSSEAILKNLTYNSGVDGSRKGLVVGQVQSGKTANMAGLMAMAADAEWNFFIILSGTIDKLREQTRDRFKKDFHDSGNLHWEYIESPGHSTCSKSATDMSINKGSPIRYFTVVLKNRHHLQNLIKWMRFDKNKYEQMKVLVIDDEADQASINTEDIHSDKKTSIHSLILNLVDENDAGKRKLDAKIGAMNYISYTATPYANVLNDSSEDSLFPKDFIISLPPSNEYFGSQHIFGIMEISEDGEYIENDGLNIIRTINETDFNKIKEIHKGEGNSIPESLIDSLCWFYCGVSTMREWGYKKPVSMLVHTSHITENHQVVARLIENWISRTSINEVLRKCRNLWEREIRRFNKDKLKESYPDYGGDFDSIKRFPNFNDLESQIRILHGQLTKIAFDDDSRLIYNEGVHLCIDNSDNRNGIDDSGDYIRLAYPEEHDSRPDTALAFLVIGGNTLSRGLTIEGLISTYFLRGSTQADSLMQMGRWFGYRKGYETVPRVWMTEDTEDKFIFLAKLEHELREDLRRYSDGVQSPADIGPRILNTPGMTQFRVTSASKSQDAISVDLDFAGSQVQTISFDNTEEFLNANMDATEQFLNSLGTPEVSPLDNSIVWRGVSFKDHIKDFIDKYRYQSRTAIANQKSEFIEWIEEAENKSLIGDWNVIVSGTGDAINSTKKNSFKCHDYRIGKVNRSKLKKSSGLESVLSIGVLRAPKDLLADIPNESKYIAPIKTGGIKYNSETVENIRLKEGIESNPQLIIYIIDKESKASEDSDKREDLGAKEDIVGIFINVPGKKSKVKAKALTVRMTSKKVEAIEGWSVEE